MGTPLRSDLRRVVPGSVFDAITFPCLRLTSSCIRTSTHRKKFAMRYSLRREPPKAPEVNISGSDNGDLKPSVENYENDGRANDVVPIDGPDSVISGTSIDPVYEAKARVLNKAIQDIGMGWYQWQLFIVIGFGWASDNLWPICTSLIFTPIVNEFHPTRGPFLTLSQNIGLLVGAMFWGFG